MRAFAFGFAHLCRVFDPNIVLRDTPLLPAIFYVFTVFIHPSDFTRTLNLFLNLDLIRSSTKRVAAAVIYSGIIICDNYLINTIDYQH